MAPSRYRSVPVILAATAFAATAFADTPRIVFEPAPAGTQLTVSGTSTMHDWSISSSNVLGSVKLSPDVLKATDEALSTAAPELTVSIPVKSLLSGKGMMDRKTHKALDAKHHPNITYTLSSASGIRSVTNSPSGGAVLDVRGNLTIAGSTRPLNLELTMTPGDEEGQLKVSGTTALKMTDFGISPPTVIGMLRTGDDVTVSVSWLLNRQSGSTPKQPAAP